MTPTTLSALLEHNRSLAEGDFHDDDLAEMAERGIDPATFAAAVVPTTIAVDLLRGVLDAIENDEVRDYVKANLMIVLEGSLAKNFDGDRLWRLQELLATRPTN